jgi:hypothetical protein
MGFEKYEDQMAAMSNGGREGLTIWDRIMREMPGEQKIAKSFEVPEITRRLIRPASVKPTQTLPTRPSKGFTSIAC